VEKLTTQSKLTAVKRPNFCMTKMAKFGIFGKIWDFWQNLGFLAKFLTKLHFMTKEKWHFGGKILWSLAIAHYSDSNRLFKKEHRYLN